MLESNYLEGILEIVDLLRLKLKSYGFLLKFRLFDATEEIPQFWVCDGVAVDIEVERPVISFISPDRSHSNRSRIF